jgi:hypothetical protein
MREDLIGELYLGLDSFINSTIVNNLPPESLETFIKMNEEKRPQAEIEQFLKEQIPNAQEVLANAFIEFRNMYLGNVAVTRNAPLPPGNKETHTEDSGSQPVN